MKARKITAVMLAAAMCFSAAGASVYADDPAIEAIEDDFYEAAPVEESAYEEDLEGEGIIDTEYNCDTFTDGAVAMGDDEEDAIDASADADFDIVRELSDAVECGIEEGIEESEAYDAAIEAGAEEAAYEEDAFEEEKRLLKKRLLKTASPGMKTSRCGLCSAPKPAAAAAIS